LPRFDFDASLHEMPKPKYTLDALEKLREARVDEATKVLAEAVRARETAAARRQAAELALETRTHEIAHIRERERVKLEMGGADAHDLALASAWELGAQAEIARLAAAVTERKNEETGAQQKEAEARAAVAMKRADADVVHKDHDRFDAGVRKAELAKEEEAAEEAWRRRS
jgi:pyruvate/oxaloacetate carboxyltransferase